MSCAVGVPVNSIGLWFFKLIREEILVHVIFDTLLGHLITKMSSLKYYFRVNHINGLVKKYWKI